MPAASSSPDSASPVTLSRREKLQVVALYSAIATVTAAAFVLLLLISARYDHAATSTSPAVLFGALGIIAYVFGLRHGVDADHIAAIDNTTRKLLQQGRRPLSVGSWFSLGHSSIVVGLVVALVFATNYIKDQIPAFKQVGFLIGTSVSGTFLFLIGLINVVIVLEVYRIFQGLRQGRYNERELDEQLSKRGFMNRYFGRLFRVVDQPWQMYPVGVLFGLGFDTATEIVLIGISVGITVNGSVPLLVVLVLPLLFTCGMILVDTTDAILMRFVYGWAFRRPIRKIYYNLTITIISVLVAFAVGGVELLQVIGGELNSTGPFWGALAHLDFETLGIGVVALFAATWGIATWYYRYRRFDEIPFGEGVSPPSPGGPAGLP